MKRWLRRTWFTLAMTGGIVAAMLFIRSIDDLKRWWNANPDRQLAEFVIKHKGTLVAARSEKKIENYAGVPFGRFEIREVSLAGARLDDRQLGVLASRDDIEVLDLSRNPLTDEAVVMLASLRSLKTLDLTRTHVTAKGVARIQRKLPDCKVTARPDDSVAQWALETGTARSVVVEVDLSSRGTRGRRRCVKLEQLPEPELTVIEADFAGSTTFDDRAAEHLVGLKTIESLSLDRTGITDKAVDVLVTLKKLKKLSVKQTVLSERGIERLRKALIDTEISW